MSNKIRTSTKAFPTFVTFRSLFQFGDWVVARERTLRAVRAVFPTQEMCAGLLPVCSLHPLLGCRFLLALPGEPPHCLPDTGVPAQPLFSSECPNTYLDLRRGSFISSSFVSSHFRFSFVLDVSVLPASDPSAESGSCAPPLIFLPQLLVSCGLSL